MHAPRRRILQVLDRCDNPAPYCDPVEIAFLQQHIRMRCSLESCIIAVDLDVGLG